MKKALCFQCQKWSSDTKFCEHCEYIISQEVKDEIKQKEYDKLYPPKPPSKFAKAIEYMRVSRNPLLRLIYILLMGIYMIYVGIIMIMLYISASAVG